MKLHIGCGTIYLRDYINIDLPGPHSFLANDRVDLVEKYITKESNYYGRHQDKTHDILRAGPLCQEIVCDRYGSFLMIPCASEQASEILARQVIEHLSPTELKQAIVEMERVLKDDGAARISVPDYVATIDLYAQTKDAFYLRHLTGPKTFPWGYHILYNKSDLVNYFLDGGFEYMEDEPNIHSYPAITLQFRKIPKK